MNTPVALRKEQSAIPALPENETIAVLQSSLYPGATEASVRLVLGYCKASGLDPFQKPVHLVPMWDSKARQMRDVVMPGIGLYRTQAARSGAYAGVTEPEFGPDMTEEFPEESGYEGKRRAAVTVAFPAWCKVIVKRRMADGQIAEFAATERWKENYATSGKDSKQPNAMWVRRPYAQLAKCAEAQALRKAFPEFGSQPTADEMEGKEIDMGTINRETGEVTPAPRAELPPYADEAIDANLGAWKGVVDSGRKTADSLIATLKTKAVLSPAQEQRIRDGLTEQAPIDAEFVESYSETEGRKSA